MKHLSYKDRPKELELFSLEKRKLCGDLTVAFQCLKGPTGKMKKDCSSGRVVTGQMDNGFKLKEGKFRLTIQNELFAMRGMRRWNRLPRSCG